MDNTKHRRLQELDRSDFEIIKGEPDIRGWDVKNGAGQKIGEVEELIVDAQQKQVRYMVVDLDDNELKLDHRKVLFPIGLAELHSDDDDVLLPAISVDQISALPVYDRDNLDDEAEETIFNVLDRNTATPLLSKTETSSERRRNARIIEHDDNFYKHDYFQDKLYKNRKQEVQPAQAKRTEESEYEQGLRLWELRHEGDADSKNTNRSREQNFTEETHRERIRDRRKEYEERRSHPGSAGNSIVDRINREGLQDA